MAIASSKTTRGVHKCIVCQHLVVLDSDKHIQPVCPRCNDIGYHQKKTKNRAYR